MKISQFIYMWMIILSVIMAMSTSSMFALWIIMEINMLAFIPIINTKNLPSTNSIILYFIVQSLASSFFILSMTFSKSFSLFDPNILFIIPMMIKLGAAPFHSWFPQMSEGLTYFSLFLLTSVQKVIPLFIISLNSSPTMILFIFLSSVAGTLGGFNQFSVKKILSFSSISHLSWMLSLLINNSFIWIAYLVIYSIIMAFITQFFSCLNMHYFSQSFTNISKSNAIFILILMLSLGGMPPFIGFFMKWMSLKIILLNMKIIPLILISSSLLNMFFYTRLLYPIFLKASSWNKWTFFKSNPLFSFLMIQLLMLFIVIPMM
uniref:NADH-ubiquinone oxidoreductase chain 2 n=1 Tax=Ornithodoros zumpti TaxID=1827026 RepID=A0A1P8AGD9_9ACAR|nr:NADH dehydrogenase subunit 2 [Ornithodoros zumpti]